MQALAGAAVLASCEVMLVVAAHFWRQSGDIITPAGQNLAHDRVNALLTHMELQSNRLHRFGLRSQHDAIAEQIPPGS